jgi:hypothetical protein
MRVVLGAILAFVGGFVAVYVLVVAGSFFYISANNIFDRDGGIAMAIMFAFGPLCGLLAGTIATVIVTVILSRRQQARAAGQLPPPRPLSPAVRLGVALIAGVAAYYAAWGVLWIVGPLSFRTYAAALAVWLVPIVLGLATAGLVAYPVLRNRS